MMHTHAFSKQDGAESEVRAPVTPRFCNPERQALLRAPGLGPKVVSRLEEQGLTSIESMRELGVERVVEMVCRTVGSSAWKNRHAALARALNTPEVGLGAAQGRFPERPEVPTTPITRK